MIRTAGRLGVSIAAVTERIRAYGPLLDEAVPAVPAGAAELVPDWRDLVILTPRLDGERLVTDADLTDAHIARAAHEVGTTQEDVRERLSRYASYCGFTARPAPRPDPAGSSPRGSAEPPGTTEPVPPTPGPPRS